MLHPLTGVDHLLAMLGVGAWAALQAPRSRWLMPLSFLLLMIAGAWAGASGYAPAHTEIGIAASVLALGLLILRSVRVAPAAAIFVAGLFALFHGFAHGMEMAAGSALSFGAGFIASSAALQLAGLALGLVARRDARVTALGGAAIAACGALLMLQTF
jgi:urease accessory protein